MNNKQIAKSLHHLADLLELNGENAFRVGAYRRGARALENSRKNIENMKDEIDIPNIGKAIGQVIIELIQTGTTPLLEELKKSTPPGLLELLQVSGIGPKTIYTLHQKLEITNMDELRKAAEAKKIQPLKGFGPKKEQKIVEAITSFQERPKRVLLSQALLIGETLLNRIKQLPIIKQAEIAGSLRRRRETIKDIDLLVSTEHPEKLFDQLQTFPEVVEIIQHGDTKIHFLAQVENTVLPVDLRLVTSEQFASALHHVTGSREHNIRIRQRAKKLGYKVNEYGIENTETGEPITFLSEASFFGFLQLPFIAPELREDRGEIEAAESEQLPQLVDEQMYKGDLHTHSLYSDGAHSILEMVQAAKNKGYEFLAITDHSQSLRVASGLTISEIYEQWEEIDRLNEEISDFTILKGTEVDILADGSLDYSDEILAKMDIVIASVHTSFRQDQETMTKRIIRAMENPYVHIIGHPTGRLLLRRDSYALDIEQIFAAASRTGTILELNANPYRLDLNDLMLKKAKDEYQLKFSINTDAHSADGLSLMPYGIATARRGWLEQGDVLNMVPWSEGKNWLKKVE